MHRKKNIIFNDKIKQIETIGFVPIYVSSFIQLLGHDGLFDDKSLMMEEYSYVKVYEQWHKFLGIAYKTKWEICLRDLNTYSKSINICALRRIEKISKLFDGFSAVYDKAQPTHVIFLGYINCPNTYNERYYYIDDQLNDREIECFL